METDHTKSEVPSQSDWLRAVPHVAVFIGASLGFLFVLVTVTPLVSWWSAALAGPWEDPSGEVLIVAGGSALDDGTIGATSYWRGVYAAEVWKGGETVTRSGAFAELTRWAKDERGWKVGHSLMPSTP